MPQPVAPPATGPAEQTRQALIAAAIQLFGRDGFRGTSTRAIAQQAGTNVASIAYHFGGKQALRTACGQEIAIRLANVFRTADITIPETPQQAEQALENVLASFAHFILLEQKDADIVGFVLRELSEDSPVIDALYAQVIAPRHRELCHIWEQATGLTAESDQTRLNLFAMIGQVLYFRIGRKIVNRRMEWAAPTEETVRQITQVLLTNLRASIAANREL